MANRDGKSGLALNKLREEIRLLQRTNRELNERVVELDCLYQILRSLATTMSLSQTMDAMRSFFVSRFRADRFALFIRDPETGVFLLKSSYRVPKDALPGLELKGAGWTGTLRRRGYLHRTSVGGDDHGLAEIFGVGSSLVVLGLRGADGSEVGLMGIARDEGRRFERRDVALLRKLGAQVGPMVGAMINFERTKELSFTDPLTGVHNRRYFNQVYVREFERAKRYERPMSVLMIDIDHFKVYNDTLGHLAGDSLLRRLAQELSESLRRTDFLARYGGEEFVVLLPETDYERARRVAEKLRRHVESVRFEGEEVQPEGTLTISVGVASYPRHSDDPLELLELSDRSLYAAKAAGRNRVGPAPEELTQHAFPNRSADPEVLR